MNLATFLRFRVALGLLVISIGVLALSGCTGGWGEPKPTISMSGGQTVATGQNATVTVASGQTATFSAAATGTGPFTYQWYRNGVSITGATSSSYSPVVTGSDNGAAYTVAVTNAAGTVTSPPYMLTVNTTPLITTQPASQAVAAGQAATFTVIASGTAPLSYQWYENGAAITGATSSSYTSLPATVASNGSPLTVTVTNALGSVTSTAATLTVSALTSTLTFAAIPTETYGNPAFAVNATSASNGAVTYAVVSGPATIAGNMVTFTGAGPVVLSASQAANDTYAAETATANFNIASGTSALNFTAIPAETYGNPAFAVSATSASGGAVTYAVVSGPATITGNMVALTGAGPVVLSASQAASGNYAAAAASTSFTVAAEVPALNFATVPAETYGNPAFAVSATSASGGAVTYAVVSGPATITGNMVTLTGAGPVVLGASQAASGNYAAAAASTSFTVAAEVPALNFATIPAEAYGNPAFAVSATSASGGAVTYAVVSGPATIAGNMVTLTGAGPVVLSASQAASGNYASANASATFTVAGETPTLSFATIGSKVYGNAAFAVSATSASNGAVTYAVVSGPATIAGNMVTLTGAGPVVLSASQAAYGNYAAPANAPVTFTVVPAKPVLVFSGIPIQTYGNPPFAVSATSASSGAVTYTVVSGPATIAGNMVTLTGAGTVQLSASQVATANYTAPDSASEIFGVADETPTLSFAAIPAQTYGNPAFAVSASSASTGAVTYTVVSGPATIAGNMVTLTGTGPVQLSASQVANGNYAAPANASATFTVGAPVIITPISPANQTMAPGSANFSATASSGPLTWSASGGTISGGVWSSPNTIGTYTITATSVNEPSISVTTTATISAPIITTQPVSKNACSTYSPSLSVAASYATSYQWTMNGNSIGTGPTLTFANASSSNSGNYICTAINAAGSVASNTVTLNIVSPTTLTITTQPSSVSVYATQTATFSVGASGTGKLTYQWYTGAVGSGTAIAGATSSTFTTASLTTASSGTTYYVAVTDPDCTGTTISSSAATLTVSNSDTAVPPTIVIQPAGQTATVAGTATFSVTASGSGTLTYQWYRVAYSSTELSNPTAGVAISGATSSTYTVPAGNTAQTNDGDNYYVVVANNYGSALSNRAVLGVGAGIVLQIAAEPQTEYVAANTLASFSTTATCTGCIPAYQWYWYAPGSSTATALTNGAVSTGTLSGATVAGATTSSLTLQDAPTTASNAIFYVVATSTNDGTTPISGTNPLTSSTAGLFVGSLGTVGNTTAGDGLCNSSSTNWVLNGTHNATASGGTSSGDVPYQNTNTCTIELTDGNTAEAAAVYWPTLISTAKFSVSFTVALTAGGTPADGFTMVLADPSQGAKTSTLGVTGSGLGVMGIPGFVVGFDTYQNGNLQTTSGCANGVTSITGATVQVPCDPVAVPYMAVGQGASSLYEHPWSFVNGALNTQSSTDYSPSTFANATHSYVVTVVNSIMTVTMDGNELFTGTVSLPPVAYLGFTASTGGSSESVTFSQLTATISAP